MANRMLTRWKDFLNFCEQQGWVTNNPLAIVQRKFVGGKEGSRDRVLSWDETKQIDDPVLWFILLTGLRPSEAIWALKHRKAVDIPTKTTLHTLPKSHLIRWFLKRKLALPSSHLTLSNRLRRAGATYRPHDLRRTFVTRLNEMGVAPYVVEKLVNHKLQGVMAVYNHAEYWPERNAAQRLWDRKLITQLRTPSDTSLPVCPSSSGT
jgi:integrase